MPKYLIIKRISVEAETLEEAIQNHEKGQTKSLNAEEERTAPRNDKPRTLPVTRPPVMRVRPH